MAGNRIRLPSGSYISNLRFQISDFRLLRAGLADSIEFFEKRIAVFLCCGSGSDFVVQMALAGDVGVLELFDPAIQLTRNAEALRSEICYLRFEILEGCQAFENTEHRADFTGGAAGNVEKGEEFARAAALKTFGIVALAWDWSLPLLSFLEVEGIAQLHRPVFLDEAGAIERAVLLAVEAEFKIPPAKIRQARRKLHFFFHQQWLMASKPERSPRIHHRVASLLRVSFEILLP